MAGAHTALLDLEELAEGDVERLRGRYQAMARQARADLLRGLRDTDTADLAERPERSARGGPAARRPGGPAARRPLGHDGPFMTAAPARAILEPRDQRGTGPPGAAPARGEETP